MTAQFIHSVPSFLLSLLLSLSLLSCSTSRYAGPQDEALLARAQELSRQNIIVDGHVDLPYRLRVMNFQLDREYIGIPVESDVGDFDFVRAREGGLDAPFMSIFIPARYQKTGGAFELADSLIQMVEGIIRAHPDKFGPGRSTRQVELNFREGRISLPMGMENGAPIEDDLANIAHFYKQGIRYITLTHSKDNQICDSSYDDQRTWGGLSPFGRKVVREMNRVGIMVDISHVSDSTFYQVMRLTGAPCIASHSSCRKFTPGFERNMSDDMIRLLGENGGVMMINFGSTFLDQQVRDSRRETRDRLNELLEEKGLERDSEKSKRVVGRFERKNRELLWTDVRKVADHIDHAVSIAGIDHVGLGSDFDGVGDSLPAGLKDVSQYPNLIYELLRRGYTEEDIAKICYKNLFRVWEEVEKIAGKM